ncbi:hypothetical protein [Pseudomonas sp.]|uniref:hypothetical protein n=1 Tax=Pseudomonas sp. TaxID=306 RepID=UPI002589EBDC|nr:hypothetical protein [Pseudomonas sp.]
MTLRQGVVVATHPEDHSVDLVMVDNGERLTGVQVVTPNGSARTGTVDMPSVPERKDKWDITQNTGQDMKAMVAYVGRNPVVLGFLYPQINQMLFNDPKTRVSRHQSDVISTIDGDGNISLQHPGGAFIQIGEKPEKPDLANKNADASLKPDRNTGKKVYLRVELAGNVARLTMTPDGTCELLLEKDFDLKAKGDITMEAEGNISMKAGGTFSAESAGKASIKGSTVHLNED